MKGSHKFKAVKYNNTEDQENISSNYGAIPIQKNLQALLKDKEKMEKISELKDAIIENNKEYLKIYNEENFNFLLPSKRR